MDAFGSTVEQINEEHERLIDKIIDDKQQLSGGFDVYLSKKLPYDFGVQNTRLLTSFLRSMLQHNPEARKPTTDLLKHPYLAGNSRIQHQKMYKQ